MYKTIITILLLGFVGSVTAQNLPPDFYDTRFAANFVSPISLEIDDRGNTYVVEHGGKVWVVDTSGERSSNAFIDISEEVTRWHDHGLMDIALDKDFFGNGYVYLLYTVDRYWEANKDQPDYVADSTLTNAATWGRVTRYTADPATDFTTILPNSRKILLGETPFDGIPIFYNFHGLGKIRQADDHTLLISVGDGAGNQAEIGNAAAENNFIQEALDEGILRPGQDLGSYRAQSLGSLQGKILRIDPETGEGVPSNPFYRATEAREPISRIWLLGLRNPYNFTIVPNTGSHDPTTGDVGKLYIGDVGNGAWEELNVATRAGQNFGWPHMEGVLPQWGFRNKEDVANVFAPNPLASQSGCPEYLGFKQTYIDMIAEELPALQNPCNPSEVYEYVGTAKLTAPVLSWSNANWNLPWRAGTLGFSDQGHARFVPLNSSESPISGELYGGYSGLSGFIADFSDWPPQYRNKLYFFDYNGWIKMAELGEQGELVHIEPFMDDQRLYALEQNTVLNCFFYLTHSHELRRIDFGGDPPPQAVADGAPRFGSGNLTVNFDGSGSSDQNDAPENLSYRWDFGDGSFAETSQVQHTFSSSNADPRSYTVKLVVTDPAGSTSEDSLIISLNNTPPTAAITSFQDGDRYPTDRTNLLELRSQASDLESPNEELSFEWQTYLHHNDHFHPDPIDEGTSSRIFLEPLGCAEETYYFRVRLTVTDPHGLATIVEQELHPDCSPTPPAAIDLTGIPETGHVDLAWLYTTDFTDAATVEIQRGSNFNSFATIHTFNNTGNLPVDWRDEAPLVGSNVYRVKTISADRTINYSNLAQVNWSVPPTLKVAPNPTKGLVTFTFFEPFVGGPVRFELYDAIGKLVRYTDWEIAASTNGFEKSLLFNTLPSGTYFYLIQGEDLKGRGRLVKK